MTSQFKPYGIHLPAIVKKIVFPNNEISQIFLNEIFGIKRRFIWGVKADFYRITREGKVFLERKIQPLLKNIDSLLSEGSTSNKHRRELDKMKKDLNDLLLFPKMTDIQDLINRAEQLYVLYENEGTDKFLQGGTKLVDELIERFRKKWERLVFLKKGLYRISKAIVNKLDGGEDIDDMEDVELFRSSFLEGNITIPRADSGSESALQRVTTRADSLPVSTLQRITTRVENLLAGRGTPRDTEIGSLYSRLNDLENRFPEGYDGIAKLRGMLAQLTEGIVSIPSNGFTVPNNLPSSVVIKPHTTGQNRYYTELLGDFLNTIRDVSSNFNNSSTEKQSSGDGHFRRFALSPLLRGLKKLLDQGKVDPNNFSWNEVIAKFDHTGHRAFWLKFSGTCNKHQDKMKFEDNIALLSQIVNDISTQKLPLMIVKTQIDQFLSDCRKKGTDTL